MSKIESKLYQIHAEARQGGGATPTSEGGSAAILPNGKENGFARVNSVAEGSPSAIAVSKHCTMLTLEHSVYNIRDFVSYCNRKKANLSVGAHKLDNARCSRNVVYTLPPPSKHVQRVSV